MSVEYEVDLAVASGPGLTPRPPTDGRPPLAPRNAFVSRLTSRTERNEPECSTETYKKKCELALPREDEGKKTIDEQLDELIDKLKARLDGTTDPDERRRVMRNFFDGVLECPEERACVGESGAHEGPGKTDARHKHVSSRIVNRLRSIVGWSGLRVPEDVLRDVGERVEKVGVRVHKLEVVDSRPSSPASSPRHSWGSRASSRSPRSSSRQPRRFDGDSTIESKKPVPPPSVSGEPRHRRLRPGSARW